MKIRIEFVYNQPTDDTTIYVWIGMERIIDTRTRPGKLSSYDRTLIKKELEKEFKNYKE